MMPKEEIQRLVEKFGGRVFPSGQVVFANENFLAYTSAIEEKHQEYGNYLRTKLAEQEQRHLQDKKQIAMLRKYVKLAWHENIPEGISIEDVAEEALEALNDTQSTADAWEAEVKARALEELADKWLLNVSNDPTKAMSIKYLKDAASELRNQQPEQPRKPCTCDGWCDGLCLEKEGKRK